MEHSKLRDVVHFRLAGQNFAASRHSTTRLGELERALMSQQTYIKRCYADGELPNPDNIAGIVIEPDSFNDIIDFLREEKRYRKQAEKELYNTANIDNVIQQIMEQQNMQWIDPNH